MAAFIRLVSSTASRSALGEDDYGLRFTLLVLAVAFMSVRVVTLFIMLALLFVLLVLPELFGVSNGSDLCCVVKVGFGSKNVTTIAFGFGEARCQRNRCGNCDEQAIVQLHCLYDVCKLN